jgi:hypothetical protein
MRSAIPGRVRASSLLTGHLRFCEVVSDRLSRAKVEAKVLHLVYTWDRARSAFGSFARTYRSTCAAWLSSAWGLHRDWRLRSSSVPPNALARRWSTVSAGAPHHRQLGSLLRWAARIEPQPGPIGLDQAQPPPPCSLHRERPAMAALRHRSVMHCLGRLMWPLFVPEPTPRPSERRQPASGRIPLVRPTNALGVPGPRPSAGTRASRR